MQQIPERSVVMAALESSKAEALAAELDFIRPLINAAIDRGAVFAGALVWADGSLRLSVATMQALCLEFKAKGWELVCTNGVSGGSAIFLG